MDSRRWICLIGLAASHAGGSAAAGVFGYTAADGSVFLSNVPTDSRYVEWVRDPADRAVPPPTANAVGAKTSARMRYDPIVDRAARSYGLESSLLHAVISVESNYNPKAVSKKGAQGLMQLMPDTARRYGVADALDPEQNLHGGARYLHDLLQLFDSDLSLALAAYNAGENQVVRSGRRIPPIPETVNYVPRVLKLYRKYKDEQVSQAALAN